MSGNRLPFLFLYCWISSGFCKLIFTNVVWRHGDRSTLHPLDDDSDDLWPRGLGQLTNQGIKQEYELGRFLRKEYGNIISSKYRAKEIYIRSTCIDRAIMSGEASMDGFYRPIKAEQWNGNNTMWFPVPVHSVDAKDDPLLQPYHICPKLMEYKTKITVTDWYKNFETEHKSFYQFLKDKTGNDYNFFNITQIYDNIFCKKSNNKTLPEWASDDVVEELTTMAGIAEGIVFTGGKNYEYWKEITPMMAGTFFEQIIKDFDKKISQNHELAMVGYSAHDTTIAFILSGMKAYNWHAPPYGSSLMIELHKVSLDKNHKYAVRVQYRNDTTKEPYNIAFMGCETFCPYNKFKSLAEDVISTNRDELCGIAASTDYLLRYRVAVVVMLIALLISWFFLGRIIQKNRSKKSKVEYVPVHNEID